MNETQSTSANSNSPTMHNGHNIAFSKDGAPLSLEFDDVYFNQNNGAAEAAYVYLRRNNLPERFAAEKDVFTICELGFGTGLNFFLTAKLWQETAPQSAHLTFYSIEKFPLSIANIQAALSKWPELMTSELFAQFTAEYQPEQAGWQKITIGNITLQLAIGSAEEQLTSIQAPVNAWYLDGFSPAKNPDMWTPPIFAHMAKITPSGGTFATFTAAGVVKSGLKNADFNIQRIKGYGYKRHMLIGQKI